MFYNMSLLCNFKDKSCVDLFGISLPQVNYAAERIGIAANAAMSTYNEEMEKLKQSPNIAEQVIHMVNLYFLFIFQAYDLVMRCGHFWTKCILFFFSFAESHVSCDS